MFVEVHDYYDGRPILVDFNKAETIDNKQITFQGYAINVQESYEELKAMLKEINNDNR